MIPPSSSLSFDGHDIPFLALSPDLLSQILRGEFNTYELYESLREVSLFIIYSRKCSVMWCCNLLRKVEGRSMAARYIMPEINLRFDILGRERTYVDEKKRNALHKLR